MIVNLTRHDGGSIALDPPVVFEGDQAQPGVLVTFNLAGRDMTARVTEVSSAAADEEMIVTVEAVDRKTLDAESEITLANLPRPETLNRTP